MLRKATVLRRGAMAAFLLWLCAAASAQNKTQNIIFVMTDGLRWQEVFHGADAALMTKENGVPDAPALKSEYWRQTSSARREALMPFLWTVVSRDGQIYGNRESGSDAYVTNGLNFSYPGYSETLCGFPDPRIKSNDKIPNPNVTVLEWLNNKPAYHGKVAAFGAWDTFPSILNAERAGFLVNAGFDPLTAPPTTPAIQLLNRLKTEAAIWDGEPLDAFTFHTAMEYLKEHKLRVLFLSLGETDEWAHQGNYGEKVPESKYIWMAFLGPDTRGLGEREKVPDVTQSQVAATLAALLGEDYRADVPKAGAAIADVLPAATAASQ